MTHHMTRHMTRHMMNDGLLQVVTNLQDLQDVTNSLSNQQIVIDNLPEGNIQNLRTEVLEDGSIQVPL